MSSKYSILFYAAAIATAIGGIIHLMLGPNNFGFNFNQGILFVIGGIAQVFWIIPLIRRWGVLWYIVGLAGTAVFMALFFITRIQGNPITGRGGSISQMGLLTEIIQAAFVALTITIIIFEIKRKQKSTNNQTNKILKNKKQFQILIGIVAIIILIGLLVLPTMMPPPQGGPPRSGGPTGAGIPPPGQLNISPEESRTQITVSTDKKCILTPSLIEIEGTPQQTEGPYFIDGMPNRSEIFTDTSDGSIEKGIPLNLTINVFDVNNDSCIPLNGAKVDIWHANFEGVYSGVFEQGSFGKNFLRGSQFTDSNGSVNFTTVYPGWYEGRAIHIHIKVRTFEGTQKQMEWTSQFYLPNSLNEEVHNNPPYNAHSPVSKNEEDGIYNGASTDGLVKINAGQHLMLDLTKYFNGYNGTFNVVLDAN
jgi:protocatechuate 3,4-dioxygenase beta subunit